MNQVVVFIGVLTEYQGIDLLLKAIPLVVQEVPKVKFLVIGYPNEEMYMQKAKELGVERAKGSRATSQRGARGLLPSVGLARRNPLRGRRVEAVVVDVLLEPDRVVELVGVLLKMVRLAPVLQEHAGLVEPAHRHVELDALIPGDSAVLVAELDQQGGADLVGKEHR